MRTSERQRWQFAVRFRRNAFGRRSQPAIQRVREGVSEIKRTAHRDPVLGAEGAVLFLDKVSAALEQVDSSSGAITGRRFACRRSWQQRYGELLDLLEIVPFVCWADRRKGGQALAAMGKTTEALRYAEASRGLNDHPDAIRSRLRRDPAFVGPGRRRVRVLRALSESRRIVPDGYRAIVRQIPSQGPRADFARFSGAYAGE